MRARLRIADDGGVRLDGQVDERHREHGYALLDSPNALLIGVEDETELPEGASVILAGDLSRIAFSELVSLIAHGRLSGVLRVYGRSAMRTVVFGEGEVHGAASERLNESLSEVAVRMGLIEREDMERLVSEADDPRDAGRLAVERERLSERDLWNAVQEHVTTVFQAILLEKHGAFVLSDESDDQMLTVPGLSAEGLLMEGVRRLDELSVLRSGGDGEPTRVLAAFNDAFRDIFATAADAGAGAALHRAAESVFEDDPAHAAFRRLRFASSGELPAKRVLAMLDERSENDARSASELLSDSLSKVMLFLLFAAGAHLDPAVHRELHSRVKAHVARD